MQRSTLNDDPLWFKDAIIYEVPVKAFADSDADGIGDFRGLTEHLDYIQDLGVTAIWLLPFFPSPLRDDGYDISDYHNVNPIYGTLDDFKTFLDAAHQRGIRVIIELIVNHTSDQHPWFQRARKAPPGSSERNFYVWSDTPDKYKGVRIIFKDFETSNWTWDPVAQAYYWHRFYSHQPDLNYEHPDLQKAIFDVVDFWLGMGVDGLRMDAVPYLYEEEGTICENLPRTHAFLQALRAHVDEHFPNRMLLAEANQWPEDAAAYYGEGNECHMNFHFPLMPRLFMGLRMEDSFPIIDILQQTPQIPDNCQWALFLRNHDELTLEMVSDEDRDYMYRVYAQDPQARINLGIRRRLAPLLGNNRRRIELMNSLLLSLPGTPVLYYGDEIGMGDNIYLGDRNGVRTPMQWSGDRNAGFSRANPQKLYLPTIVDPEYHYETVNVEAQQSNPNSLWWWMKRLIAIRSRYRAFGRGTFELLYPENRKVLAFTRTYQGEHILVVANLSRFVQAVELDLSPFQGMVPIEIFGRTEFPVIGEQPYFLSLGPHAFFWFTLQLQPDAVPLQRPQADLPLVRVNGNWRDVYQRPESRKMLEDVLVDYLPTCSWFKQGKLLQTVQIVDAIPVSLPADSGSPEKSKGEASLSNAFDIVLVKVEFTEGMPETYVLPLAYASDAPTHEAAIARVEGTSQTGVLFDALTDRDFLEIPLQAIAHKARYVGNNGELVASITEAFPRLWAEAQSATEALEPHLLRGNHLNALVTYGASAEGGAANNRFILKLFRQVDECINSDWEIGRFLTQHPPGLACPTDCLYVAALGALEYCRRGAEPMTIGMLQQFIPESRDAWSYVLDSLRDYFEGVMVSQREIKQIPLPPAVLAKALQTEIPELANELMGSLLKAMELLGQRTAELHIALASDWDDPNFAPEEFSTFYQRSLYQYMRNQSGRVLLLLKKQVKHLSPEAQPLARTILGHWEDLLGRFKIILDQPITTMRIRCHSNYHLEEVLYTGKDFIIIDFEGEPHRTLSERRMKRSPIRDIAGMLQSFYYASQVALRNEVESGLIRDENLPLMQQWAQFFQAWVSVAFLKRYVATAADAVFMPKTYQELQVLLDAYLLEKAVYELGYELNNRPDWVEIPLRRVLDLLEPPSIRDWSMPQALKSEKVERTEKLEKAEKRK
ncbi:MAG: maltose alpha-D-glucosyltransferase [Synechococcales cyanobacterium C42_A2020_086]|nr:maltose alpha-D-glucosyltransferase [Synechococcales cyanobacterium C42_A2020_086]